MQQQSMNPTSASVLQTNKVLRNTYLLLSMTLIFSALMAGVAMMMNVGYMNIFILMIGMYGLLFLTRSTANSSFGLVSIFLFTGFMGFTLGPILNTYIHVFSNGTQLIMTALGGTGLIFFALSGYAMTTRKDFSYMGGFLAVAVLVAFVAMIANIFLQIPALNLAVSAAFVLISSGLILFQTSMIINGGERNYIIATVGLYVSLYNLFLSLLQLLGAFAGNRD